MASDSSVGGGGYCRLASLGDCQRLALDCLPLQPQMVTGGVCEVLHKREEGLTGPLLHISCGPGDSLPQSTRPLRPLTTSVTHLSNAKANAYNTKATTTKPIIPTTAKNATYATTTPFILAPSYTTLPHVARCARMPLCLFSPFGPRWSQGAYERSGFVSSFRRGIMRFRYPLLCGIPLRLRRCLPRAAERSVGCASGKNLGSSR
jgi:hypothetical protein